VSSTSSYTCSGCGNTETFDYVESEVPYGWGHFAVRGNTSISQKNQIPWAKWIQAARDKLYCSDCISAMTGVPLP